ncbi:MAG TPA: response regulator [Polyangiaceae bacterium]|jgi:DNA-binding response OmpR family regulator/chromosome segregation ATPase
MPTKVLVFESDVAFAGELRNELGHLGCTITVVDDGNLGLQQAASERPDLILLSIELPRMNGFSVCNKLKKDPNLKDVPLIIMSSESSDETFEQHKKLRTRAEDYVHKPVAFGELLQHIRGFVPLVTTAQADADGAIVIDDEIEVGATDYLLDDDDSQTMVVSASEVAEALETATPSKAETVDADVDAFAESAFGRLTGPDASPVPAHAFQQEAPRSLRNGSMPSPEALAPPRSITPAPSRVSIAPGPRSVRPPSIMPGVDVAEHDRVREELARAKERMGANDREIEESRREIEKLRIEAGEAERLVREIDELRTRLAAGAKTGGISSREFLDLREGLNKKDKEILALKEQLSKKDKEIVESQDRGLALERSKSDIDERLLALEREVAETREKNESLSTDRDLAKKASDDFRARVEKMRSENEAKDRQLNELRTKSAEERAANEVKLGSARAELDQVLANERAEQARELDEAESRRRSDLAEAAREHDAGLKVVRDQLEQSKRDALSEQSAQLRRDHEAALAALRKTNQDEVERARGEGAQRARDVEQRLSADLAAVTKQTEERLAEVRAESERREQEAAEALRAENAEKITSLENDRDSRVAALEAKALREVSEANDKLAKLDMDASALRGELQSLRDSKTAADAAAATTIADLEQRLGRVETARDELAANLATTTERLSTIEAELSSVRNDLGQTKEKLEVESSRASKAATKWDADKQSLERAKDALAVVLAQIEDTEGRTL